MAFKPKPSSGIQRLSETDSARSFNKPSDPSSEVGNTCQGCNKYFNYLRNQKLCIECSKRQRDLSNT